jgi:hypothetical protein
MKCELCSLKAESGRKLCDPCANMMQRLVLVKELERLSKLEIDKRFYYRCEQAGYDVSTGRYK